MCGFHDAVTVRFSFAAVSAPLANVVAQLYRDSFYLAIEIGHGNGTLATFNTAINFL